MTLTKISYLRAIAAVRQASLAVLWVLTIFRLGLNNVASQRGLTSQIGTVFMALKARMTPKKAWQTHGLSEWLAAHLGKP
jgi:hypothetical protein